MNTDKTLKNYIDLFFRNLKEVVEFAIFNSKWLLVPFYLKLAFTLLVMAIHFCWHGEIKEHEILSALHDVDITMVANLVKMIITGSYNSFVDKNHKDQSEKVSSSALKVKMSTSLVGVSSMFLLRVLLSISLYDWTQTKHQMIIHVVFLGGALVLSLIEVLHCYSDLIMAKAELVEHQLHATKSGAAAGADGHDKENH